MRLTHLALVLMPRPRQGVKTKPIMLLKKRLACTWATIGEISFPSPTFSFQIQTLRPPYRSNSIPMIPPYKNALPARLSLPSLSSSVANLTQLSLTTSPRACVLTIGHLAPTSRTPHPNYYYAVQSTLCAACACVWIIDYRS